MLRLPDRKSRDELYRQLGNHIWLDNAATTLPPSDLLKDVASDLGSNLYANPHSNSKPSKDTEDKIEEIRRRILQFFGANTEEWDVVFVANTTAAIKLLVECFCDYAASKKKGFRLGYHSDSHTSLVGARELATQHDCFLEDSDVDTWIEDLARDDRSWAQLNLLAYPGQSNMTGRRLPTHWPTSVRQRCHRSNVYTLLDAAALASTSPLNLSDTSRSPDFVAVSILKIFGSPHLGALIVQKQAAEPLSARRYFGGGTVDMVITIGDSWHKKKSNSLHDALEYGTLPIQDIIAVGHAIKCYESLFGERPMSRIAHTTSHLAKMMADELSRLKHANHRPVIQSYSMLEDGIYKSQSQGPIIAFNVLRPDGSLVAYSEVESLAEEKKINLRTGSLCNPGGLAKSLHWGPDELRQAYNCLGHRCSDPTPIIGNKATGVVRVSLGALSVESDVTAFIDFVKKTFVTRRKDGIAQACAQSATGDYCLICTVPSL
ncbi:PLP-dependent transferase [Aureobasidium pullulans]|uniref:PLP-dependent transferase n=1 Tax=Aureobasidium pullulans TaxID=5580 RepID=A0A4T0BH10_AURPU|nr:PLP-dependent transferase [Aureobasidium pullulans]